MKEKNTMDKEKQTASLVAPRKRFQREQIQGALSERIRKNQAILAVDAGIGLVSKMAENAGIPLIFATAESRLRMMGLPSCSAYVAMRNANDLSIEAVQKAARMARRTPVLAGACPGDPMREPYDLLLQMRELGADGILVGLPGGNGFGPKLDQDVAGSVLNAQADLELIGLASELSFYTAAVCYDALFAVKAAEQGVDLIVAHAGFTVSGFSGACPGKARDMQQTIEFVRELAEAVRKIVPHIPILCHGACLNTPEAVQKCMNETGVQGFWGGSVFDRIPMETAIGGTVSELKALRLDAMEGQA